jgi:hypothetical protein
LMSPREPRGCRSGLNPGRQVRSAR